MLRTWAVTMTKKGEGDEGSRAGDEVSSEMPIVTRGFEDLCRKILGNF